MLILKSKSNLGQSRNTLMSNLTRFDNNGIELIINTSTGEVFASIKGYARMSGKDKSTISRRLQGVASSMTKEGEVLTGGGSQRVALIPEDIIQDWIIDDNPELAKQMMKGGLRIYLYGLAGYKCQVVKEKPKTALELAKEQVKLLEHLEQLETEKALLEQENRSLSEAVDELFEYSSIIRIAKFNGCSEKAFAWRKLKAASIAMQLEVKLVPCPRYEYKNLYSHDAWRYVYPEYRLPETTTLIIK